MRRFRCQASCPGFVDRSVNLFIDLSGRGETMFHPCDTCGMLHWESSFFAYFNRAAKSFVYYNTNGKLVDCLGRELPLSFQVEIREKQSP